MMIILFDHKRWILSACSASKSTVNAEYYVIIFIILRQYLLKKCHELVRKWSLHHIMLVCMSLLLFSIILVNAIWKSCHIFFAVQILHYTIFGCFWCCRKNLCCKLVCQTKTSVCESFISFTIIHIRIS